MELVRIRFTELPHTRKLFTDFLYHYERVAPFYSGNPDDAASFESAAAKLNYPEARRAALVEALRAQNGDHESLRLLARPGAVAVVTGQQVGLFSGPCYTIHKALTAVKLARQLCSRGIQAVPVFWLATEDHDLAEVSHCWSFNAAQEPVFLRLETPAHSLRPVGEVELENPPLNELRSSLSRLPFGDELSAITELAYAPGRTMGAAFQELLRRLLPSCLLYLDPLRESIRTLAAPFLREAFRATDGLVRQLQERTKELESAGYHAQVRVEPNTTLFFLLREGRRLALRKQDGDYRAGDLRFSSDELAGLASRLSPNALLRPVMQDYLLPTVAYVGGPAEVAYFAQSQVLYRALLGRMPVAFPRATFTLLDARAAKLMSRYGLGLEHFFHSLEPLTERIAAGLIPAGIEGSIVDATDAIDGRLQELRMDLAAFDSTLASALDKSRAKIRYQLTKISQKAAREALRRDDRAEADARYLYNLIYPRKHPQERMYTALPFLARHGLDLPQRIYEQIRLDCRDHVLLRV